jgi:hypothetical protein
MTVDELYHRFLMMINKNDTNEGVAIPKGNFVLLFNSEMKRWLGEELKKDEDNIDINMIELLLVTDFSLGNPINNQKEFIEYNVPSDFFQIYGTYSLANKGNCRGVKIFNYEKKPGNLIPVLEDRSAGPSFDYEEAPFIVGSDRVKIYFDDYQIKQSFINYYRSPKDIDMEGYVHFDGTPSINVDPELDDYNCVQVLEKVAIEISRQTIDPDKFQLDKDRALSNPN